MMASAVAAGPWLRVLDDVLDIGLGGEVSPGARTQPQPLGPQAHLPHRLLARDVGDPLARHPRAWPPRPASAGSTCRSRDRRRAGSPSRGTKPAAGHPVELADSRPGMRGASLAGRRSRPWKRDLSTLGRGLRDGRVATGPDWPGAEGCLLDDRVPGRCRPRICPRQRLLDRPAGLAHEGVWWILAHAGVRATGCRIPSRCRKGREWGRARQSPIPSPNITRTGGDAQGSPGSRSRSCRRSGPPPRRYPGVSPDQHSAPCRRAFSGAFGQVA